MLPDKDGWRWGKDAKQIEMRFSPRPAALFFERGNKTELRAYFYNGEIPKGRRSFQATLTTGSTISISPTTTERFGLDDPTTWPKDTVDWKSSPVDLSYLNDKPAGKHGPIAADGEHFIFKDGTKTRFWGTNLSAYTLFSTSREMIKQQAKRLASLGFNLVRLHHMDSPWVNPNIFGKDARNTQSLDPESMEKLDWWIKCLKDEGIYVWLDLHVQRSVTAEDNIYGFDEISKGNRLADIKGYNYVNITIQRAMKAFSAAYLNHTNPYTQAQYKNEPGIIALLITNENDITNHFGNALLPDKNVPKHSQLYMRESEAFASRYGLPANTVWHAWEHGPSKIFLNDLEQRFNYDMLSSVRSIGASMPIVTTSSWGGDPLSSLPALTVGDLIDVHAYQGPGALEQNPTVSANLTDWIAAGHVIGKPLTVTEWNAEPFPSPDRHSLPLYLAGQASLQGWDALMQYAYAQSSLNDAGRPSNWDVYNDPALLATLPAAALMYRQGHVRESSVTYIFNPGKDTLFNKFISPANSVAIRTATELGKLQIAMPAVKELPWLKPSIIPAEAKVISDPDASLISENATEATSSTGELTRNWDKGTYLINTPKTQAVMGWIGGEKYKLRNTELSTSTRNASIAVQSMNEQPIEHSERIMISIGARALPDSGNKLPFRVEPVIGQIKIQAPSGLKLFKRGVLQQRKELSISYENGWYLIPLEKSLNSNWLTLEKPTTSQP